MTRDIRAKARSCGIQLLAATGVALSTFACDFGRQDNVTVDRIALSPTNVTLNTNAAAAAEAATTASTEGETTSPQELKQVYTIFGRDDEGWPAESAQVEVDAAPAKIKDKRDDRSCPVRLAAVEAGNCVVLADTKMLCTLGVDGRAQFAAVAATTTDGGYILDEGYISLSRANGDGRFDPITSNSTITVTTAGLPTAATVSIKALGQMDAETPIHFGAMDSSKWTVGPCDVVLSGRDCTNVAPTRKNNLWLALSEKPTATLYASLNIIPDTISSVWFAFGDCSNPTITRTTADVNFEAAKGTKSSSLLLCTDGTAANVTIDAFIFGACDALNTSREVSVDGLVATMTTSVTATDTENKKRLTIKLQDCAGNHLEPKEISRIESLSTGASVEAFENSDKTVSQYDVMLPAVTDTSAASILLVTLSTGQSCTLSLGGQS